MRGNDGRAEMPVYYAECDGRVYLVRRGGRWGLARDPKEFPFPWSERFRVRFLGVEVVHAEPHLPRAPDAEGNWSWKDEIIHRDDVEPVARAAMYQTMARPVAKVALLRGPAGRREVLLHVTKVGFHKGNWSLTGGYLAYGETLEEGAVREVKEELGVDCKLGEIVATDRGLYEESGNWFLTFCFTGVTDAKSFRPKDDEVGEVKWFPLDEAAALVRSRIDQKGLAALLAREAKR